jgi:hypothetical protein
MYSTTPPMSSPEPAIWTARMGKESRWRPAPIKSRMTHATSAGHARDAAQRSTDAARAVIMIAILAIVLQSELVDLVATTTTCPSHPLAAHRIKQSVLPISFASWL